MGSFFLHTAAHGVIRDQYPEIYHKASTKIQDAVKSSGLDRKRYTSWIYTVAKSQIAGTINTVKLMPLYDFIDLLSWINLDSKFNEEMMKK